MVLGVAIGCARDPEPEPPAPGQEVSISGHIIVSLLQQGQQPIFYLKSDTVDTPSSPIEMPSGNLKVVSSVYVGPIVKIDE